jgi:hypothetical protein
MMLNLASELFTNLKILKLSITFGVFVERHKILCSDVGKL